MGFTINTNVSSLNAMRNLTLNQSSQAKSVERLSSGMRINRAADDAAGLAISEGLKNQVSGLTVAGRNAQDGISLIQTAEGALTEVHNILNRMRDLTVQASNDTNNTESRTAIQTEVTALTSELGRIKDTTNFNGIQLLDNTVTSGATAGTLKIQVGADANETIDVTLANVAATLTTMGDLTVDSQVNAAASTTKLDAAIKSTSDQRATLGAQQNRLESTSRSIAVSVENLSSANSRIRDTDMAAEMGSFTKSQILSQAATAMLAQANQMNSGVMSLLQ
ncbi:MULTISPECIES: flagellin N-terminal helical domain-containing protein [unclassified Arthrobacter]|uniref:flagellin N-terminal helical domain-containing protein n=1 Tax=unclassified Arthrobacter TaxID=235627 RepID=UPI001D148C0C|nr:MULTISPECIES: flagellin [unclassified Arthrobacter]MCC3276447.1 flagellin [Arthrobacter sp. zg-Y20]MCC9178571.1 flagellin [Arthrobacter sp. zg-Y750]MDK1316607.1 flagellin [Arthrobacter sp. zg.Y20]WIB06645.1 flagellin [Arthrobacter sp. zg-Y20]